MNKDFTFSAYTSLLNELKKDYEFTSFSRVKYSHQSLHSKVILRHDIDLSLEKAVEMAEQEAEMDIPAVYFLFLRSPFYNLFSHKGEKLVKRIIELNHYIGLHFDYSPFMNITPAEVTYHILKQVDFMEKFYSIKLDSVSFHRPFDIDFFQKLELGIYPHAYEKVFLKDFKYISDSRGLWRYGHPFDQEAFKNKLPLQILIHPIWWKKDDHEMEAYDKLREWKNFYDENFYENAYNELKGFWDANPDWNYREL